MEILVTYDISTEKKAGRKRLRKVAITCQGYGLRVQNSVFECRLNEMLLEELRHKLLDIIKLDEDSLRIYYIRGDPEEYGIRRAPDLDEPLIV
jgi:CRISPR-associated protein Cas2